MANREHLAILQKGVKTWNRWRKEHPALQPDLSFADLHEYLLAGVNFSRVYLHGARLIRTDLDNSQLEEAHLHDAELYYASLVNANLSKAILSRTNLSKARMIKANLSEAFLKDVNFIRTDLREAVLTNASLGQSVFDGIDFQSIKGLDTVRHISPSAISLGSIILSNGNIPDVFLRGVGVPEAIIEQIPALIGSLNPIDYYSCFISYSSKDQAFAERLHDDLQSKGVRCWFAPHDLKIGDRFADRIEESIRIYDKLLIILSTNSVTSTWVEDECRAALEKESRLREGLQLNKTVLFPIKLDEAIKGATSQWVCKIRRERHIGDFKNWKNHDEYQKAFNRLLRDLEAQP